LVLVGLPGSGKSTVGRLAAQALGVEAHDIDQTIERREGVSIAEVFETRGEPEFRVLEKIETERALAGDPSVVVPGGGWAAEGDNLNDLRGRALTVYLHTTPVAAGSRLGRSGDRPLLDGPDVESRISDLLALRQPFYERCDVTVFTEGKTAREVADEVVELARRAMVG